MGDHSKKDPAVRVPWYHPLMHFAGHSLVGTGIFLIVAMPAVLLGYLVHKLREYNVAEFTLTVLFFLEHTILVVDALLFLSYLGFTSWKAFKEGSSQKTENKAR